MISLSRSAWNSIAARALACIGRGLGYERIIMMHKIYSIAAAVLTAGVIFAQEPPHVVFVAGDHEYRSEITLPLLARLLENHHGFRTSLVMPIDDQGQIDPKADRNLRGLEALETADLAIFYLRWRTLPDDQMRKIIDYVHSGRPMIGLRTTTHAFRNQTGEYARWNDGFGQEIFGQRWLTHHGAQSSTAVFPALTNHPILSGVRPFTGRSWLYHVTPIHGADVQTLLLGRSIESNQPADGPHPHIQPVAWTKTFTGESGKSARVFFTTLGHPHEFADENMRRLLFNAVYWALDLEDRIPEKGVRVDLLQDFDPPNTR
jgi:uncharacterized protein